MESFVRMVWEERESVDTEDWEPMSKDFPTFEDADAWWRKRLEDKPIGTIRGWAVTQEYVRRGTRNPGEVS